MVEWSRWIGLDMTRSQDEAYRLMSGRRGTKEDGDSQARRLKDGDVSMDGIGGHCESR